MCGIAGRVDARNAVARSLVERMCAAQEHRGPDSRGIHEQKGAVLGIQRLRVIDLKTGDQPLYNEDGSVVVTLNGEIYNYRQLRRDLEKRGHTFRSEGDTEVIAHLYEEKGVDLVHEIEGMFAFALWDSRRRRLVLARDRVGKKPLYYCAGQGWLSYASEIGALALDPAVPRQLDPSSLDCYLAYGYVPAPWSIWQDVRKLPPAHTLVWEDGECSTNRYWHLSYSNKSKADRRELTEELRRLIGSAVERRLMSDVPLGVFLSGGVDSSIVVAEAASSASGPLDTFSIGFADELYDERPRARQVAQAFATNHHEFLVEPDAAGLLPKLVRHYGEPFADSSAIPSFLLAEATRRHVTVALNGDGGDESFAGYLRHVSSVLGSGIDRIPQAMRAPVARIAQSMAGGGEQKAKRSYVRRMLASIDEDAAGRYRQLVSIFNADERSALLNPMGSEIDLTRAEDTVRIPWESSDAKNSLDRVLDTEVQTYLAGDLLTKVDIATMAYSLEGRSPLLDREVMEFAASLPWRSKVGRHGKKALLRNSYRGIVPDEILDGKKMGFAAPLGRWLRGDLGAEARERLTDPGSAFASLVDTKIAGTFLEEHDSGFRDRSREIWSLLVLHEWSEAAPPQG